MPFFLPELLALSIVAGFASSLCATIPDNVPDPSPEAIWGESGLLNLTVDPRLELIAVLQYLSGSKMVFRSGPYADAIAAWFSEHHEHPVLQRLRDMEECGFIYDLAVSSFMLFEDCSLTGKRFNWDPTMEEMNLERLSWVEQAGPLDEFYTFARQFALQSDFAGFFASQRDYFQTRVDDAVNALGNHPDMIALMVDWYGYSHSSYNLAISPLARGGYGPAFVDEEGKIHAYCIANIDCSDFTEGDLKELSGWLLHEFSHSFVNPLVEEHWDLFRSGEALYEIIQKKMYSAYSSWWVVVAEHLVRVNHHRISELYSNLEAGSALQGEFDSGFLFIRAAYEAVRQYEAEHGQTGTNYAEYFPTIAQYYMERTDISEEDLGSLQGFTGPINSVFLEEDMLIIYPDPERVSGVSQYIMPNVDWMASNSNCRAVSDQEALTMDLSDRNLCLFGAWGTNLILEKFQENLPLEIHPDRLVADKTYEGNDLRIILCLPNPLNPKLGMCIYTAQNTEAMQRSNAIFHGPEDWYISNSKLEVLGSGSFKNKDERWSFVKQNR